MSDWTPGTLNDSISSLDAGVSVNSEDRPHGAGEIGVLKTSALSGYRYRPWQNKAVNPSEAKLVAEPVLSDSILISRMNTPDLVGESSYVNVGSDALYLPDRIWQVKLRRPALATMRWLSYLLQSAEFRGYLLVQATGTSGSMKNLTKSDLLNFPVQYPSTSEQKVMTGILATLDDAIEHTRLLIEKLRNTKQGMLLDLLTRGIDSNGELRPPPSLEPKIYSRYELGWIPRAWNLKAVGSEFEIELGKMLDEEKNLGVPKPYLGNRAVQWDGIVTENLPTMRMTRRDLERFRLKNEDLLVCEGGEVGRAAIWKGEMEECFYQKALHRLRSKFSYKPYLMLSFLRHWTSHGSLANYVSQTSIAHLTREKLATVPLPVPKGDEQLEICSRLEAIDSRVRLETAMFNKLLLSKAGLIDDLFTGRVRVTSLLEIKRKGQ